MATEVKTLSYPLGLGTSNLDNAGMPAQYMLFRINDTVAASKLNDDVGYSKVMVSNLARQGTGMASIATSRGGLEDQVVVQKVGVDGALNSGKFVQQKSMTRVNKVIVLPMADGHVVDTSVRYGETAQTDLTKLGDMLNTDKVGLISDGITKLKNWAINGAVNSIKSGATNINALTAEDRLIANPKEELLYQGFNRREFTFRFTLSPKSEAESDAIDNIIQTFRYYSLPELHTGALYYNFPGEFEISFMHGASENSHVPKIATCALKNVSINYAPRGNWSSFANGAPVTRTLSLSFKELELIDRRRVWTKGNELISGY